MIREIFSFVLTIGTLVFLVISKKDFVHPDKPVAKKTFVLIGVIVGIAVVVNVAFYGYVFYVAYNPDFKREETQKVVGHTIYAPTYLPQGRVQEMAFHQYEVRGGLGGKNPVARATYSPPLFEIKKEDGSTISPLIIDQVEVDANFKMFQNILQRRGEEVEIEEIKIKPGWESYRVVDDFLPAIFVKTDDNVLVWIAAPKESVKELEKVAKSLEK